MKFKSTIRRLKADAKYIFINRFVVFIPCWYLRRLLLKLFGLKIGNGSRIAIGTIIISPESISIGNRTYINEFCHLDGRGGLEIGNDVSISIYTKIITASHYANSSSFEYYDQKTMIHNNVWIGCGAIVLNGSTLREGSVIGAGSVFKGNTESNKIYVGNPAKLLKDRNLSESYKLDYKPFFR